MVEKNKKDEKTNEKSIKNFGLRDLLTWVFGGLFVVGGFLLLVSGSFLAGLFTFLAGFFLLPPSNEWLKNKTKVNLSGTMKIIVVFILLLIGSAFIEKSSSNTVTSENSISTSTVNNQKIQQPPAPTIEELKNSSIVVPYEELFRNNENYVGKIVYFSRGKIIQSLMYGNKYDFRIDVSDGYESQIIFVSEYTGKRFLENDFIEFYGRVIGLHTYNAVLGNQVTVPQLELIEINLLEDSNAT